MQYVIPWTRLGKTNPKADNVETLREVQTWMDKQLLGH